jgi:hypothetical protein
MDLEWHQQFVLWAGLLLVLIQFTVSGDFSKLWGTIWNG